MLFACYLISIFFTVSYRFVFKWCAISGMPFLHLTVEIMVAIPYCRPISNFSKKSHFMTLLSYPIIVIAYGADARAALSKSLTALDVEYVVAESFLAAEDIALSGIFNGILVDLPSIIKAKDEEKLVACSLTGFYPTLRARTMGGMLIPMTMPGEARQDSSLNDFIKKTCSNFNPRNLRASRRKEIVISTLSKLKDGEQKGFTHNISWGGAFIADAEPEKYKVGEQFPLYFHEIDAEIPVEVKWAQAWGEQKYPGIGVKFMDTLPKLDEALLTLLGHSRQNCKDRMVMR